MYLKLMLILIYTYFIKADDDSDQRYIDLLPEAEKQAFLDLVARRLHKEVKHKKSPINVSGEISNEELDVQGEFVKRIIAEESGNLRRQRTNDKDEALTVQGLDRAQTEKSAYLDLTLRSSQRERRNNNETDISVGENSQHKADEIPVKIVYDKEGINDTVSDVVGKRITDKRLTSGEISEGLDIQVRGIRRNANEPAEFRTHTEMVDFDPDKTTEKVSINNDSDIEDTVTDTTTTTSAETMPHELDSNPPNFTASIYEDIDDVSNDSVLSELDKNTKKSYSTAETFSTTVASTNPTLITQNETVLFVRNVTNTVRKKHKKYLRSVLHENITSSQSNFKNSSPELPTVTDATTTHYISDYTNTENRNSFDETTVIIVGPSTATETKEHLRSENHKISNESVANLQNNNENKISELPTTTDSTTFNVNGYTTESTYTFNETTLVLDDPIIQPNEDVVEATVNAYSVNDKAVERSNNINENSDKNKTKVNTNDFIKTDNKTLKANDADENVLTTIAPQPITVHPGLASTAHIVVRALEHLNVSDTTDSNKVSATRETDIFKNLVNALRHGLQFKFEDESGGDETKHNKKVLPKLWLNKPNTMPKEREPYNVYEIPADEAPFVMKSKIQKHKKVTVTVRKESKSRPSNNDNQEQPYYVPIYNYSPEHAYFNAYNRFGPNDNQNNEEFIDRNEPSDFDNLVESIYNSIGKPPNSVLRKFKFSKKKAEDDAKTRPITTTKGKDKAKLKNPKFTEVYLNPDDYLDTDYYFGRKSKPYFSARKGRINLGNLPGGAVTHLPDSDDELHVRNAIQTGLAKNYMSGVRQLLYTQQIFGYIPITSTTTTENPRYRAVASNNSGGYYIYVPNTRNKEPKQANDISIDYYFGVNNRDDTVKHSLRLNDIIMNMNNVGILKNKTINETNIFNDFTKVERHASQIKKFKHALREKKMEEPFGYETIRKILNIGDARDSFVHLEKMLGDKHKRNNRKKEKPYKGTIREILSIGDARDSFLHLKKMLAVKLPIGRSKESEGNREIKPFLDVLKDMIGMDDQRLEQYDWLGTTVDILSALEKLSVAIETLFNSSELHPSDMQLLKYIEYLYVTSKASLQHENNVSSTPEAQLNNNSIELTEKEIKEGNEETSQRRKRKSILLPRNKHRKKEYLKAKGLINRVWLYIRGRSDQNRSGIHNHKSLEELQEFLTDVRVGLFDLHNALKHIALVTKYNKQKWFRNLKSLYLKEPKKKQLLEVLLHLTAVKLFELVEESATDKLEQSYSAYIETHQAQVQRTKDEFVFIMKVISEIKQLEE